jgi:hypothetical protein
VLKEQNQKRIALLVFWFPLPSLKHVWLGTETKKASA